MRLALPAAFAALVTLAAALPVHAESGYGAVTCSGSTRQGNVTTCDGHLEVTFTSEGADVIYGIDLRAPAAHCSPVGYSVVRAPYATGADVVLSTEILQAGQGGALPMGRGWPRGANTVRIIATGFVAGCNTGVMHSWGVNWATMIVPE